VALDDHCITTLILCDISKAFHRVWHTGLLLKLKADGVDGKLFNLEISHKIRVVMQ
jgi:hypothetical protein